MISCEQWFVLYIIDLPLLYIYVQTVYSFLWYSAADISLYLFCIRTTYVRGERFYIIYFRWSLLSKHVCIIDICNSVLWRQSNVFQSKCDFADKRLNLLWDCSFMTKLNLQSKRFEGVPSSRIYLQRRTGRQVYETRIHFMGFHITLLSIIVV